MLAAFKLLHFLLYIYHLSLSVMKMGSIQLSLNKNYLKRNTKTVKNNLSICQHSYDEHFILSVLKQFHARQHKISAMSNINIYFR